MVSDPYRVLGVSRDASPEEIKKAYRAMARKYHPDMHPDDPSASEKMNEINEAYDMLTNPAKYERAQARAGYGSSGSSGGSSYGSGSSYSSGGSSYNSGYGSSGYGNSGYGSGNSSYDGRYGWAGNFGFYDFFGGNYGGQQASKNPQQQPGDSNVIIKAIQLINTGRYQEALQVLATVVSGNRNARWYYLCSLAYYGGKDMTHAVDFMRKAVEMDPNNRTYAQLLNDFMGTSRSQSTSSYYSSSSGSRSGFRNILRMFLPIIVVLLFNMFLFGGSCYGCFGCQGCLGSCLGNRYNYTTDAYGNRYYYNNGCGGRKDQNSGSTNDQAEEAEHYEDADDFYDEMYNTWGYWF